jgi:endonuclease/exonuclease/phosphatase family metal-dependent hydrolase
LRSCDRDRPGDDFGVAIISRYQFLGDSRKSVRLCTTPFCPGNEPRVLARVIIRVGGHPIHIYNTHLAPGGGAHSRMAELIIRQVVQDGPDRAVLLGDFYLNERSAAYRVIGREFRDAWFGAPHDDDDCDAEGLTHPTLKPTEREDYVFISDGFRVEDARVTCTGDLREMFNLPRKGPARDGEGPIFKRVPDHLPLTVRLALI